MQPQADDPQQEANGATDERRRCSRHHRNCSNRSSLPNPPAPPSAALASPRKQRCPAILAPVLRRSNLRSVPWRKLGRNGFTVSLDRAQFKYTFDDLANVVEVFTDTIGVKRSLAWTGPWRTDGLPPRHGPPGEDQRDDRKKGGVLTATGHNFVFPTSGGQRAQPLVSLHMGNKVGLSGGMDAILSSSG
jgi:hypothetical protein